MDDKPSDLDVAVERLSRQVYAFLEASANGGDALKLKDPLADLQEAVADLVIELEDPASPPIYRGWLPRPSADDWRNLGLEPPE